MNDYDERILRLEIRLGEAEEKLDQIKILTPYQIRVVTVTANVVAGIGAIVLAAISLSSLKHVWEWVKGAGS